jgi:predicted NBD/HSP70 family sugar kinase
VPDASTGWLSLTGASRAVAVEVLRRGPLPRSALARRLGLSAGSLTRLTKPMLDAGVLREAGPRGAPAVAGRPTTPLDVVAGAHHFAGVKLTGDHAYAVRVDLRARTLDAVDGPLRGKEPSAVTATVADLVSRLTVRSVPLTGLGVSIGGRVSGGRTVVAAPYLSWSDVDLGAPVTAATGLPTVVDNDVLALTRAAHWFGAGRGVDRFALVTVGVGVGYGLVVHDALVEAPDAGLGLVGHLPLDPLGPVCERGHRGCAVAMLSSDSIRSSVSVGLGRAAGYEECLDLAVAGDPVAGRVVCDAGLALGRLIALVANLTMAERILVCGDGARLAEVAAASVREGVERDRDPGADPVAYEVRRSGFEEWARGAAVAAIQSFARG